MDELEFQQQFVPAGPVPLTAVLARHAAPDLLELEEAAAGRIAEAEREERRGAREMLNRQMGDPIGHLSVARSAAAAARDRVMDLQTQLESAREVLARAEGNMADWSRSVDEVLMSPRAVTPDLLAGAKRAAAEVKVDAMLARAGPLPETLHGPGLPGVYGGQAVNLPGHVQHPECDQVAEPSPRSPAMGPLEAEKSAQYAGHLRTRPAMPEGKGSVNGANPDEMPGMWSW